jgi:hypothetical protein
MGEEECILGANGFTWLDLGLSSAWAIDDDERMFETSRVGLELET